MIGLYKERQEPGAVYRTDLPMPTVNARDILVKVKATAICGTDMHIMDWTKYAQERLKLPMVFGHEFAGDIVEIGSEVTEFKVGDRVAGETHIPCNHCMQCLTDNRHICENMKIIGVHAPGSFAEYISFPEDCAFKLPDDIDYNQGAMLEPMGVAVHGIDAANVANKTVAIYGCGPIGLMAVGAAKAWGAKKIYALDIFDEKLKVAMKMGADVVINTKDADAAKIILGQIPGGVDAVIDYTGSQIAILSGFSVLRKGGTFVMVGLMNGDLTLSATECIIYKEATVIGVTGRLMYKTWDQCIEILKSGKFDIGTVTGGIYKLQDFEQAFNAIKAGNPGKMLLIP